MSKVLMVIAPTMFRDEEYALPREILLKAGADVVTASTEPGVCTGKLGMKAEATIALANADPDDYDAILFVGGSGASLFFDDPAAHALAKHALEDMRVVGAITRKFRGLPPERQLALLLAWDGNNQPQRDRHAGC